MRKKRSNSRCISLFCLPVNNRSVISRRRTVLYLLQSESHLLMGRRGSYRSLLSLDTECSKTPRTTPSTTLRGATFFFTRRRKLGSRVIVCVSSFCGILKTVRLFFFVVFFFSIPTVSSHSPYIFIYLYGEFQQKGTFVMSPTALFSVFLRKKFSVFMKRLLKYHCETYMYILKGFS